MRFFEPPFQGFTRLDSLTQGVALGYNKLPLWGVLKGMDIQTHFAKSPYKTIFNKSNCTLIWRANVLVGRCCNEKSSFSGQRGQRGAPKARSWPSMFFINQQIYFMRKCFAWHGGKPPPQSGGKPPHSIKNETRAEARVSVWGDWFLPVTAYTLRRCRRSGRCSVSRTRTSTRPSKCHIS